MADTKPMRKIILSGGDYTGRLGEAAQDYIYIVESIAPVGATTSAQVSNGSLNLIGDYRRAKKFNATGRYEPVNDQDFEVYEFAGAEDHCVFIEQQV